MCYAVTSFFLLYVVLFKFEQLGRNEKGNNIGDSSDEMGNNLDVIDWGSDFKVEEIACGDDHTCALSTNGSVRCCGLGMFPSVHTL